LWLNTLGTGIPADQLIALESADVDAIDADAIALRRPLDNALVQAMQPQDVLPNIDDLPDLQRALLLAQESILVDPVDVAGPYPWTPQILIGGTAPASQTVNRCSYIRIGRRVIADFSVQLSTLSALTGSVTVTLPLPARPPTTGASNGVVDIQFYGGLSVGGFGFIGFINTAGANLQKTGGTSAATLTNTDITAAFRLDGTLSYFI